MLHVVRIQQENLAERGLDLGIIGSLGGGADTAEPGLGLGRDLGERACAIEDRLLGGETPFRDGEVGESGVGRGLGGEAHEAGDAGEEERKGLHGLVEEGSLRGTSCRAWPASGGGWPGRHR